LIRVNIRDELRAIEAMEALLFGGARLKTAETLKVVNRVIEVISARGAYDQQHRYLLQRCLEILLWLLKTPKASKSLEFLDSPTQYRRHA